MSNQLSTLDSKCSRIYLRPESFFIFRFTDQPTPNLKKKNFPLTFRKKSVNLLLKKRPNPKINLIYRMPLLFTAYHL